MSLRNECNRLARCIFQAFVRRRTGSAAQRVSARPLREVFGEADKLTASIYKYLMRASRVQDAELFRRRMEAFQRFVRHVHMRPLWNAVRKLPKINCLIRDAELNQVRDEAQSVTSFVSGLGMSAANIATANESATRTRAGKAKIARGGLRHDAAPPPLTPTQAAVRRMLLDIDEDRALTGPKIIDELNRLDRSATAQGHTTLVGCDQSTLTTRVIPVLRDHYGVRNKPKVGYYTAPEERRKALAQKRGR